MPSNIWILSGLSSTASWSHNGRQPGGPSKSFRYVFGGAGHSASPRWVDFRLMPCIFLHPLDPRKSGDHTLL